MRWFKKMVKLASEQKVIYGADAIAKNLDITENLVGLDSFLQSAKLCRVFVMPKYTVEETHRDIGYETEAVQSAPFSVFSIEIAGDNSITVAHPKQSNKVAVRCIMAVEISPNNFNYFMLTEIMPTRDMRVIAINSNYVNTLLESLLRVIATQDVGITSARTFLYRKPGFKKKTPMIKDHIFIVGKKHKPLDKDHGSIEVDWTHRWEVRGHWRAIQGVGKNREGDYCIDDFTWVRPFTKGPEELPIIKKSRIVCKLN